MIKITIMATSEAHHLKLVRNPETVLQAPYLEAIKQAPFYGRMNRRGQNRKPLITPENVALFNILNPEYATGQDLWDNPPELAYCSTHIVLDRLEDAKAARQTHPNIPLRPLSFFTMSARFIDQVILRDIKEPVTHAKPHQRHLAYFDQITEDGGKEELPPIPVGKIYNLGLAVPREKPTLRAVN